MFFFFFDKYKDELYASLEIPYIKNIAVSKDFYFQKAKDKFEEFQKMDTSDIDLSSLVSATKQVPFSFERLLNSYNMDSSEYKLLLLIGQSISYFDVHAAMKKDLNEYDDKRTIALAYVRQNIWVKSLLEFKSKADVNTLPGNVRNTILYIQDPENNISIVSEERKKEIADTIFNNRDGNLLEEFEKIGIVAENPLNNGVLYSWILHSDSIKKLWYKPSERTTYWLGGSTYGGTNDVSKSFIENGVFAIHFGQKDMTELVANPSKLKERIAAISDTAARTAFELFSQMKAGDRIAMKSSFAKGNDSTLRIKAIGTIINGMDSGCVFSEELGHTIPVDWKPIVPYVDYALGTYRRTIHKVTKKEDIQTIFNGHKQYLEDDFRKWVPAQAKSNSNPFASTTIETYVRSLKTSCCDLEDVDLYEPNLFYQTDAKVFTELKARIKASTYYDVVNAKARNGAFSAAMNLYEKFLHERTSEIAGHNNSEMTESGIHTENVDNDLFYPPSVDINYWWLNANPKTWSFSELRVGEEIDYSLLNDNGNKRRIYQNFLDAKADDYVIGYESTPVKQIVALLKVSKENDGESPFFEKLEGLSVPIDYSTIKDIPELQQMECLVNPQGSLFKLAKDEYDLLLDIIREQNPVSASDTEPKDAYTKDDFLKEVYMTSHKYDDIVTLLERKKNIILQGAPGVGKSFLAKRLAYSVIGAKDKNKVEMIQFHQSYSYEDFIEGFRPLESGGFEVLPGVFKRFCRKAENDKENKYFFIIDEINRGNLSKIMGELMLLLENDKRGTEFIMPLTYSGIKFSVPENVYIIGMMNTADRSLAMIDYALRRRFSFVSIEPAFNHPEFIKYIKKDDEALGDKILAEMTALNVDIKNDLGVGFQVGHSYFCNCDDMNEQWYNSVLKYEILPLLDEYWFDNEKQHSKWVKGLLPDEKNPN